MSRTEQLHRKPHRCSGDEPMRVRCSVLTAVAAACKTAIVSPAEERYNVRNLRRLRTDE